MVGEVVSSIDQETFRRACARFATGIAIATIVDHDGAPHGLTINSFTSVSCCPPLVLICLDYRCTILPQFRKAGHFGINFLAEAQRELSTRFSQRGLDRFQDVTWDAAGSGVPKIPDSLAFMDCAVRHVVEAGDHAIFVGEVVHTEYRDGAPLLFFNSRYCSLRE
jgi:flavin reductase (DIM6/NTAB) family NADH-FMN oxidoreductase RutF